MKQPLQHNFPSMSVPDAQHASVPALIGQVYESAPLCLRAAIIEHLLKPLGVLALVVIANGIFAKIRLHSGRCDAKVRPEDARLVHPSDVVALADRVQHVSIGALDSLVRMLSASPVVANSEAATLLMAVPQVRRNRRFGDAG